MPALAGGGTEAPTQPAAARGGVEMPVGGNVVVVRHRHPLGSANPGSSAETEGVPTLPRFPDLSRLWIRAYRPSIGRRRHRSAYATRRCQRRRRDAGRWGRLIVVVRHRHPLVSKVFEFVSFSRLEERPVVLHHLQANLAVEGRSVSV